ncbi:restriction endonuclease subunit S [Parapedobacter sp. SGR-10]|uniref:restriction endonuclease subunit S n=1 Tax=Parapedobacter sp. SGR-10 TaxID=2710879 RepID=UPI0013D72D14|nr:restriction endonuclease subunit S [Parapedobacter sp. SGR-10]NGF56976.1 restriction endonuclease subunit S [Parapedobacter sp. SGR-10]
MEKSLPKGWVETKLGDVTTKPQYGWTTKSNNVGKYRYLRTTDIGKGSIDWHKVPFCQELPDDIEKYLLKENDILISRAGSIGLSYLVDGKIENSLFASYLIRFKPFIVPKFMSYYLNSKDYWRTISDNAVGIAVQNINAPKLQAIPFPLPPLAEQERIVAKLDRLFAQHEKIKKALDRIPELLKAFRQQVLTQAVESKKGTRKLKDFLTDIKYGTSKKSEYGINGTPILRIPNIENGRINDKDLKYSLLDEKEYDTLKLRKNDILIIRSNGSVSLVGQSAIITSEHENYSYAGYLIRIRLNANYEAEYLNYIFKSNFIRSQMINTSRSTSGVNNINSKEIQELNIPDIELDEQQNIVKRVESLFAKADAIEARYQALKAKIDNLPQAILHKAFKGELVPQLPTDGDAKDLLAEIMALKEETRGRKK